MSTRPPVRLVHVVVPARDESGLLPRLMASLTTAIDSVRRLCPTVEVRTTVVLDSCTDDSASVIAEHPGVDVLSVDAGIVGVVRALGVARVHQLRGDLATDRVWVASTDADSAVPADWLLSQVELADEGHDLVVGTVRPDELDPVRLSAWVARHQLGEGHPHVHGANLGFRLRAHDLVGGFRPLATGEDVDLVGRLRRTGLPWVATGRVPVVTSARHQARAPEGFAAYLGMLQP